MSRRNVMRRVGKAGLGLLLWVGTASFASAEPERRPKTEQRAPAKKAERPNAERAKAKAKAGAQGERPRSAKARVNIRLVHMNDSGEVDPRVQDVGRQLRMTKYSGFRLVSQKRVDAPSGERQVVELTAKRKLAVMFRRDDKKAPGKLTIRITEDGDVKLNTTVSVPSGEDVLLHGGKRKDGELMVAIRADY